VLATPESKACLQDVDNNATLFRKTGGMIIAYSFAAVCQIALKFG